MIKHKFPWIEISRRWPKLHLLQNTPSSTKCQRHHSRYLNIHSRYHFLRCFVARQFLSWIFASQKYNIRYAIISTEGATSVSDFIISTIIIARQRLPWPKFQITASPCNQRIPLFSCAASHWDYLDDDDDDHHHHSNDDNDGDDDVDDGDSDDDDEDDNDDD